MTRSKRIAAAMAGILGIGLLAAWIWTGREGIPKEEQRIYEEALKLQKQADSLGFEGFSLADYPVAVYDGTSDYVFYRGEVTKRKPVLETFAGTVYPVEDHFEVIIPAFEQFARLMSLAGGAEGMADGSGYGEEEYEATLWHEAFHAYQMTEYAILGEQITAKELRVELAESERQAGISEEERIVREVDKNEERKRELEIELKMLQETAEQIDKIDKNKEADVDGLWEAVLEYRTYRNQRLAKMSKEAAEAEIRCELVEGTAYYAEANIYRALQGEKAYEKRYLQNIAAYEGGRGKYYRTGLAKCLILDQICPGWKKSFDFTKGLDEVMEEYGKEQGRL